MLVPVLRFGIEDLWRAHPPKEASPLRKDAQGHSDDKPSEDDQEQKVFTNVQ